MESTMFTRIELITFVSNFIYLRLEFSCESPLTISSTFVPPSILPSLVVSIKLHSISITLELILSSPFVSLTIFSVDLNITPNNELSVGSYPTSVI